MKWNIKNYRTLKMRDNNNNGTFNLGNLIDIKLIIVLVSSVSGAKAKYSPFASINSKACTKLGDTPLPISTNMSFLMYLDQFNKTIMASFLSNHEAKCPSVMWLTVAG